MKKILLFAFDVFAVNFFLFVYLFAVGGVKVVEARGNDWFIRSIFLSGIGTFTDIFALVTMSVLMVLFFGKKLKEKYVFIYIYIVSTMFFAGSFILKLEIGHTLFHTQSSINPISNIVFSIILSAFCLVDFYKKFEENKEKVDVIFVGATKEQCLRFKNFARTYALAENAEDLTKVNKVSDSKVFILVDLSFVEIKRVMAYLSFSDCRVACLYSSEENKPVLPEPQINKWAESHDFILIEYEKFISENM